LGRVRVHCLAVSVLLQTTANKLQGFSVPTPGSTRKAPCLRVDKVKLGRSGSDKAFDLNFSGPTSGAYYTSDGGHGGSGFGDMLDSLSFARFLSLLRFYHGDGRIHKYDTGPSLWQGNTQRRWRER
jgi:hypothetical protein